MTHIYYTLRNRLDEEQHQQEKDFEKSEADALADSQIFHRQREKMTKKLVVESRSVC